MQRKMDVIRKRAGERQIPRPLLFILAGQIPRSALPEIEHPLQAIGQAPQSSFSLHLLLSPQQKAAEAQGPFERPEVVLRQAPPLQLAIFVGLDDRHPRMKCYAAL